MRRLIPVPVSQPLVQRHHRLCAGQDQRPGMFSHCRRVCARRRADGDVALGRCRLVYHIDPASVLGNNLQSRGGIHNFRGDPAVTYQDRHRIVSFTQRDQVIFCGLAARKHYLKALQHHHGLLRQVASGNQNYVFAPHHSVSPSLNIPALRSASSSQCGRKSPSRMAARRRVSISSFSFARAITS